MEILKVLSSLPKWFVLLLPRLIIAVMNFIPCRKVMLCSERRFSKYHSPSNRSYPKSYTVSSLRQIHWGHFIVCYLRGMYRNREIYHIKEFDVNEWNKDCTIERQYIKKSIKENDLDKVIKDSQFLCH